MDILISGSIAYDYLMRFPGKFADSLVEQKLDKISVSFLVEDMVRHFGGVAPNIAYTLAMLGHHPRLIGTAGVDFSPYAERLTKVGVDVRGAVVIDSLFTASFFCNTDDDNNQIASFYTGAMARAGDYRIADVIDSTPDLVVISPDDTVAMQRRVDECIESNIKFLFDPSQQVARLEGDFLRHGIEHCYMLMCNEYEWEVIQKKTGLTHDSLLKHDLVFINTLGEDGAHIYHNGETTRIGTFEPRQITDPTGAGDAFRAGVLRGLSLDLSWELCGYMGALCGTYVLENIGTQNHQFTLPEFVERFRASHDDQGALDVLLAGGK